jgi:site-specific recombinase XerD
MTWEYWIKQYVEVHCTARGLRPKTIDAYFASLRQFRTYVRFRLLDQSPDALAPVDILNYVEYLRKERKNGDAAVNRQITILRNFYRAAVAMDLLAPAGNPLARFPKLKPPKKSFRETLTDEEVERLLQAPPTNTVMGHRDRAILALLYGTGIRASECAGLLFKHVDLVHGTIRVTGKGGNERTVPLNRGVRDALTVYEKVRGRGLPTAPYFVSRKGNAVSRQVVFERVRKYVQVSRIDKKMSPHGLRHTFATHLVRRGVNLVTLRDLLGHRQLTSTQIYLHMTADDLRKATDRHPIGRLLETVQELLPDRRLPYQFPPGTRITRRR